MSLLSERHLVTVVINVQKPFSIHSKKCWVVLTQFWVKYGQTQTLG